VRGRSKQHVWLVRFAVCIPIVWLVLGLSLDPDPRGFGTHEQLGLSACYAREWLGVPCPTCGVTTASVLLLHGHPLDSFQNQPFGLLLVLGSLAFSLQVWIAHRRGQDAFASLMESSGRRWARAFVVGLLFGWAWSVLLRA